MRKVMQSVREAWDASKEALQGNRPMPRRWQKAFAMAPKDLDRALGSLMTVCEASASVLDEARPTIDSITATLAAVPTAMNQCVDAMSDALPMLDTSAGMVKANARFDC